ncbi:hypothetical protein EVAR_84127_1 [Eumeta japonica]|uniref:Uncharacterized protein n=1 Tax=Eumeta variegata TaxID=151549 RepID=A0A4C1UYW0_EUMVA|nr:hypothetical protein EVAR_84127_1 [Eumeta japonica]
MFAHARVQNMAAPGYLRASVVQLKPYRPTSIVTVQSLRATSKAVDDKKLSVGARVVVIAPRSVSPLRKQRGRWHRPLFTGERMRQPEVDLKSGDRSHHPLALGVDASCSKCKPLVGSRAPYNGLIEKASQCAGAPAAGARRPGHSQIHTRKWLTMHAFDRPRTGDRARAPVTPRGLRPIGRDERRVTLPRRAVHGRTAIGQPFINYPILLYAPIRECSKRVFGSEEHVESSATAVVFVPVTAARRSATRPLHETVPLQRELHEPDINNEPM